ENADPHTIRPAQWQVRLYRRGQIPGETNSWAVITGKSSEEVASQLEAYRQLEVRQPSQPGERSGSAAQTLFNAAGTIAVVSDAPAGSALPDAQPELAKRIEELRQGPESIAPRARPVGNGLATEDTEHTERVADEGGTGGSAERRDSSSSLFSR